MGFTNCVKSEGGFHIAFDFAIHVREHLNPKPNKIGFSTSTLVKTRDIIIIIRRRRRMPIF